MAIWASGTPKQFLLHIWTALHVCKQLGLETQEADAMMVLEAAYCKLDAAKAEYAKLAKNTKQKAKDLKEKEETPAQKGKKNARESKEQAYILAPGGISNKPTLAAAKKAHKEAAKKVEEAKLAVAMAGAKPFKLYGNLLSDKALQPWEKIIKAQVMQAP